MLMNRSNETEVRHIHFSHDPLKVADLFHPYLHHLYEHIFLFVHDSLLSRKKLQQKTSITEVLKSYHLIQNKTIPQTFYPAQYIVIRLVLL